MKTATRLSTVALLINLALLPIFAGGILPGCTSTSLTNLNAGVKADLASPAGKALVADLFSSATSITVAALGKGANLDADVAAADSLGGILEAYSTLPTTTAQLSTLATTAASTSAALTKAAPQIVSLIDAAKAKGIDPLTAIQTVASGVYAATGISKDVGAVKQVAAIGNP